MTLAGLRRECKKNLARQIVLQTPYYVYAAHGSTPNAAKRAYYKALYNAITTDDLATEATLLYSNLPLSSGLSPSLFCTYSYSPSNYFLTINVTNRDTTSAMLGYIGVVFYKSTKGIVYCLSKAETGDTVVIQMQLTANWLIGSPDIIVVYAIPLINTGTTAAAAYAALDFTDGESIRTNIPILVAEGAYGTSVLAT